MRNIKKILLPEKGRAFSEVSVETENNLNTWLAASGLSEQELLMKVRDKRFNIKYEMKQFEIYTSLQLGDITIGLPFICNDMNCVRNYHVELALLLICVASKTEDETIQNYVNQFIKINEIVV